MTNFEKLMESMGNCEAKLSNKEYAGFMDSQINHKEEIKEILADM